MICWLNAIWTVTTQIMATRVIDTTGQVGLDAFGDSTHGSSAPFLRHMVDERPRPALLPRNSLPVARTS